MKVCYCDETGTGEEPYAVLLGVVVDATRMHVTKDDWSAFLTDLSRRVGQDFQELHTRHFYSGAGIWKALAGEQRSQAIDLFVDWFSQRRHHVVFSAVDKNKFSVLRSAGEIPDEIGSVWRAMGFHVALAMQRNFQTERKNKGNTIFVFDEEVMEETRFHALLRDPPAWSETYYGRNAKRRPLCQLVDAPYFADSKNVVLLQVADFLAYFVRRHIELREKAGTEKYAGEAQKVESWFTKIVERSIPYQSMYPKRQRCSTAELFWELAPESIRSP
jgi:hypothetical protein